MNNLPRIVLIGGTGFIGRSFATVLEKAGKNVLIVSRGDSQVGEIPVARANFTNKDEMRGVLEPGDVVVHLACSSVPKTSETNPEQDYIINVRGSEELLSVCSERGIRKFVFLSSGGTVYGVHDEALTEETPCAPVSAHGKMKLAVEKLVMNHAGNFTPIILRPGNIYGRTPDRDRKQGVIEVALARMLNGEPVDVWGDGSVIRDYLHIDDLSALLFRVIEDDAPSGIYNAGSGLGVSLNSLLEKLERTTGVSVKRRVHPSRDFDVPSVVLDSKKAERELGWTPRTSIEEGLHRYYEHMRTI